MSLSEQICDYEPASGWPPGWQSLWRGLRCLRQLVVGVNLAAHLLAGVSPEGLLVADG